MESPIIVTIENVLSPENDLKMLIARGQTVSDVKHFISIRKPRLILAEVCLLYDGRLLQGHESVHDLFEGDHLTQEKKITFDMICTSPNLTDSKSSQHQHTSSLHAFHFADEVIPWNCTNMNIVLWCTYPPSLGQCGAVFNSVYIPYHRDRRGQAVCQCLRHLR